MTMISTAPQLISAPAALPVSLAEMRLHLRVDGEDEDSLISGLIAAATGMLDGWTGLLGRGIMPQTWREEFSGWGTLVLRLPDVSDVTVTGYDGEGAVVAQTITPTVVKLPIGWAVTCDGAAVEKVVIDYEVSLPATRLPVVKAAMMLLIGHWFANREAVAPGLNEVPLSAMALIDTLRWKKL